MAPPRSLTEAYQRAVEEEPGITTYRYRSTRPDGSPSTETVQVERSRDSPSPLSMRLSRRRAQRPERQSVLDQLVAAERDAATHQEHRASVTESENSVSVLENATDDSIGRALLRSARDERLRGNLQNGTRIFSRARPRERPSLTAENLQRGSRINSALPNVGTGSEGTGSSGSSNPPMNIPREWGRKSRKQPDWLKRFAYDDLQPRLSPSPEIETNANADPKPREKPMTDTRAGPEIDWLAAANEESAHSNNNSPRLPQHSISRWSPPQQRRNPALDRIREWEIEEEFTASSLQISTSPPFRNRNKSLSDIREREEEVMDEESPTTAEPPAEHSPKKAPVKTSLNSPKQLTEQTARPQIDLLARQTSPVSRLTESKTKELHKPQPLATLKENQRPTREARTAKMNGSTGISPVQRTSSPSRRLGSPLHKRKEASPLFDGIQGEGTAVPDTPVIIYRNQQKPSTANSHAEAQTEKPKLQSLPEPDITDSQEILRRLSRIASSSPSPRREPASPKKKPDQPDTSKSRSHLSPPTTKQETSHKSDAPLKSEELLLPPSSSYLPPSSLPNVVEPKDRFIGQDITPLSKPITKYAKTPIVTGAWIDTPVPATKPRPESYTKPSKSDPDSRLLQNVKPEPIESKITPDSKIPEAAEPEHEPDKLQYQGPPLARSALSSIVQKAKRKHEPANAKPMPSSAATTDADRPASQSGSGSGSGSSDDDQVRLGDSTIDSLEGLMASTMHDTQLSCLTEEDRNAIEAELDLIQTESDEHGIPLSKAERERRQEMLAYERMSRRLRSLGTSIRDAKRGIEGLEHKFENNASPIHPSTFASAATALDTVPTSSDTVTPPPPCKVCGCTAGLRDRQQAGCTRWHPFTWPFPAVYHWPADSRPRLTWFGVIWLLFWAYVVSETTINELWGHKFYTSTKYYGYGVDINAPRPPFATFKYLFKPIRLVFEPIIALCMELYGIG